MNRWVTTIAVVAFVSCGLARAQEVDVTVVAILASDRHTEIDKKLQKIAEEVRKREPSFTGFRIARTTFKKEPLNHKESFALMGELAADITVLSVDEKEKKVKLTVKAPHAGEVTYTTVPEKYFPILTRYQTDKDKERLILAVMVKPQSTPSSDKELK